MEIPVQAQVECTDGVCGRSVYVLIDPLIDQVTHLVVREISSPNTEYLVPVELLSETIANTIRLRCSKAELEQMDPFVKTTFVEKKLSDGHPSHAGRYGPGMGRSCYETYANIDRIVHMTVEHLQIPAGEFGVRRGTRVKATDGFIGHVDEFVVNPENRHITHMVVRAGVLWGQKDVIIPLSAMGDARDDTMFLKLDKHQVESLPTFPMHMRWS